MNNNNNDNMNLEETQDMINNSEQSEELLDNNEELLEELPDDTENSDSDAQITEEVKKESFKIYSPLVIATLILALLVVSSSVYFAFFTDGMGDTVFHKISGRTAENLYGTWIHRNGDIVNFYTFTDDGRIEVTSGTVTSATRYGFDKTHAGVINIYSELNSTDDSASSPLNYSISKKDGIAILNVSDPSNQSKPMEMQRASLPKDLMKPSEDFKADESAVGTWQTDEKDVIITLTAEGRIKITFPSMVLEGVYEVKDGELTYKYTYSFEEGQDITDSFNYEVSGDKFKFFTDSYEYTLTKVDNNNSN